MSQPEAYVFEGIVKWAKVFKPDAKYGKYSLQFYPTDEVRKEMKPVFAGTKTALKEDDDGFFYTIGRDPDSFRSPGKPVVVDAAGNEFKRLIGNGSRCEIIIVKYPWKSKDPEFGSGWGVFLDEVKVLDHVVYEAEGGGEFVRPEIKNRKPAAQVEVPAGDDEPKKAKGKGPF